MEHGFFKQALFLGVIILVTIIPPSNSHCYKELSVPEKLSIIKKECPGRWSIVKRCTALHNICVEEVETREELKKCNAEYDTCADPPASAVLSLTCRMFMRRSVDFVYHNAERCLDTHQHASFYEIRTALQPLMEVLDKENGTNQNFHGNLTELFSWFEPYGNLEERDDYKEIREVLKKMEDLSKPILKIPFSQWHGGLEGDIGKVVDRIAVAYSCGHSVASEFMSAWAREADCLEKHVNASCVEELFRSLKNLATHSNTTATCNLYVEAMKPFEYQIGKVSHDGHYTYRDANKVLTERYSFTKFHEPRLTLVLSTHTNKDVYENCDFVKREISAAATTYSLCKGSKECDDQLSASLKRLASNSDACKKAIIPERVTTEQFQLAFADWWKELTLGLGFLAILVGLLLWCCQRLRNWLFKWILIRFFDWLCENVPFMGRLRNWFKATCFGAKKYEEIELRRFPKSTDNGELQKLYPYEDPTVTNDRSNPTEEAPRAPEPQGPEQPPVHQSPQQPQDTQVNRQGRWEAAAYESWQRRAAAAATATAAQPGSSSQNVEQDSDEHDPNNTNIRDAEGNVDLQSWKLLPPEDEPLKTSLESGGQTDETSTITITQSKPRETRVNMELGGTLDAQHGPKMRDLMTQTRSANPDKSSHAPELLKLDPLGTSSEDTPLLWNAHCSSA